MEKKITTPLAHTQDAQKTPENTGNKTTPQHPLASKLSSFNIFEKEYDISPEDTTLKQVLHRMADRLEFYEKIIIQIMQPEEFSALYECSAFSDTEKSKLFELYKQIMIISREILRSIVENEEKDMIATIDFTHIEISSLKPDMLQIIKKMKVSWSAIAKKGNIGYFG
ncbi:MAG: hypothetical protein WC916_00730 [Candidatus Woesearchaeota archaeon]